MRKSTVFACLIAALAASNASAQFGGQTGISSNLGGFGNTGLGNSSFGLSSSGNTAAAGGTTGAEGISNFGNLGGFDAGFGASGNAFSVGGANGTGNRTNNAFGGGQLGALGGFGLGLGGFGFGGGGFGGGLGGFGQNQNQEPALRATVKIGFEYAGPPATARAREINSRIARIPLPSGFEDVQVLVSGRTAVLRGRVSSADDISLLERLVRLEPGIDNVETQVNVQDGPSPLEVVPPPPAR